MTEIESWQNGKWIPNPKLGISAYDAHFFFGWAVFEAIRSYGKRLFLLKEHIDRLYRSASLAEIEFDMPKIVMTAAVRDVIQYNKSRVAPDDEYRVMIFVSPGNFKIYKEMGPTEPVITISLATTSRYAEYIAPFVDKGFTGVVVKQPQIPSRFLDPKIKSCSRLHLGIADREAGRYGTGTQPILLDEHGYVAESSGGTIAFIDEYGTMCLPKNDNILRGCTMEFVEDLAADAGIQIVKDNWDVYDLVNSTGMLFTSTFYGLVPCYNVIYRGKKYKLQGKSNYFIDTIINKFSNVVGVDINKQWKDWYGQTNNINPSERREQINTQKESC